MKKLIKLIVLLAVLAVGSVALWYYVLRPDPPKTFSSDTITTVPVDTGPLAGTWTVSTNTDGTRSEVGYRVSEVFARGAVRAEAVGRTDSVSGALTISGTRVTTLTLTADMKSLRSDESRRDNTLRTRGLQTDQFPTATFVLAAPIAIEAAGSAPMRTTAQGDLTLHGQTRPVTVTLEAARSGDRLIAVGAAPIALSDFGIDAPDVAGFVTVDNKGTMEFKLYFSRKL